MYELNYEENRVGCIVRSFSSREEAAEIAASEIKKELNIIFSV